MKNIRKNISKKITALFLSVICIVLLGNSAGAEIDPNAKNTTNDINKVEISFKVGDSILKINGQDLQVEKPFVINGVTLVPLRVITEAFGAQVDWNGEERSVTLTYNEKIINLYIDQKQVTVDGKDTVLLEAPQINNNITMVPIRFVTENFGADVSYNEKTAEITVVKEIEDPKITDYEALLKKTTKTRIGDSYFGWSMDISKDLSISERSFDGTTTKLLADDESHGVAVVIWENKGETLETLLAGELELKSDMTLITQGIEEKAGVRYAKTVFRAEGVLDTRFYIKDNKVYMSLLFVEDYAKYNETNIYTNILDSFAVSFDENASIEDLSNINAEGYRIYEDKNLKFSINVLPDWQQGSEGKPNETSFIHDNDGSEEYYDSINVNMYSRKDGETVEQWGGEWLTTLQENMHPDYYEIIKMENGMISGVNCKKMYYSQTIGAETMYIYDVYLVGENYKYNVYYHVNQETYQDKEKLAQIEQTINSFRFTEPDANKVGPLMNPRDKDNIKTKVKRQNAKYKWSVDLPVSLTADYNNNDKDTVAYSNGLLAFQMNIMDEVPLDVLIADFDEEYQEASGLWQKVEVNKEGPFKDKGTNVYKYVVVSETNKVEIYEMIYIFNKNGYSYFVNLYCPTHALSDYHQNLIKEIWQSMKFE